MSFYLFFYFLTVTNQFPIVGYSSELELLLLNQCSCITCCSRVHEKIHSQDKPHSCSYCGKAFKQLSNLKLHQRIHSDEKPYACSYCEKTFRAQGTLKVKYNYLVVDFISATQHNTCYLLYTEILIN